MFEYNIGVDWYCLGDRAGTLLVIILSNQVAHSNNPFSTEGQYTLGCISVLILVGSLVVTNKMLSDGVSFQYTSGTFKEHMMTITSISLAVYKLQNSFNNLDL